MGHVREGEKEWAVSYGVGCELWDGLWDGLWGGLWGACRTLETAPERHERSAGPLGSANCSRWRGRISGTPPTWRGDNWVTQQLAGRDLRPASPPWTDRQTDRRRDTILT